MRAEFLVLFLASLTACSTSIYGWTVRTNSTPPAASFHPGALEREPVAVFDAQGSPGLGLGFYLAEILKKVAPDVRAIAPQETATRINTRGLAADYARMRADSEHSNILEAALLQKIGTAVGARYVFQPRLAAFTQTMTERWKFADIRLVQTRSSILRLSLQLWDTQTGELVWTSVAEAILASEAASQDPVFLEDAARIALGSVIADLLGGKTTSTYTPLTEFLNQLIQKPEPEEKSK
jgi:hypothetical protein